MQPTIEVEITVNGVAVKRTIPARQHLVDFLRDELELTGTHLGCEQGVCGACTVLLDGQVVRGCLVLGAQAHGKTVETVEGLSDRGALRELQAEFARRNAAQCGYCTPGMLLTAQELLARNEPMTRDQIRQFMSGNFCRCTGYHAIIAAIAQVLADRLAQPANG